MSRVHDMGGRYGDPAIVPEPQSGPVFETEWHARALALTLASGTLGAWNLDISRHARERTAPKDYARYSYYEKWMAGLATLLVEQGVVTRDELSGSVAAVPSDLASRCLHAQAVDAVLAKGGPTERDGAAPRFGIGDRVRTRRAGNRFVAGGHTRLPGYAAGLRGTVILSHGCHILPDAHAHGRGEAPEPLYTVQFDATEVWGQAEHPGDTVTCDLWESYLEAAPQADT